MLVIRTAFFLLAASLVGLLVWTSIPLFGQDSATGSIRGTVVDPSGARVPQASIVVVNEGSGARRRPLPGLLSTSQQLHETECRLRAKADSASDEIRVLAKHVGAAASAVPRWRTPSDAVWVRQFWPVLPEWAFDERLHVPCPSPQNETVDI